MRRFSIWLGLLVVLAAVGCNRPPQIPLKALVLAVRDDNWLDNDQYYLELIVYHGHSAPVSGTLTARAYGDVFDAGGEETLNGDNYDLIEWTAVSPGSANGTLLWYYIDDPELKQNDLTDEVVNQHADVAIVVEFQPTDPAVASYTSWLLVYRQGKIIPEDQLSSHRTWLKAAGVPTKFLPAAAQQ